MFKTLQNVLFRKTCLLVEVIEAKYHFCSYYFVIIINFIFICHVFRTRLSQLCFNLLSAFILTTFCRILFRKELLLLYMMSLTIRHEATTRGRGLCWSRAESWCWRRWNLQFTVCVRVVTTTATTTTTTTTAN